MSKTKKFSDYIPSPETIGQGYLKFTNVHAPLKLDVKKWSDNDKKQVADIMKNEKFEFKTLEDINNMSGFEEWEDMSAADVVNAKTNETLFQLYSYNIGAAVMYVNNTTEEFGAGAEGFGFTKKWGKEEALLAYKLLSDLDNAEKKCEPRLHDSLSISFRDFEEEVEKKCGHKIEDHPGYSEFAQTRRIEIVPEKKDGDVVVDLSKKTLSEFPAGLFDHPEVTVLKIYSNNLSSVPSEIAKLVNLRVLDLSANKLKTLPKEIGRLVKLEELILGGNPVEEFPPEVSGMTGLWLLELRNCGVSKVPKGIGNFPELRDLNLYQNKISELDDELFRLVKLEKLNLNENKLNCIPAGIKALTCLQELFMSENQFSTLPEEMGCLVNLKQLIVCRSAELISLNKNIGDMAGLEELNVSECSLSELPASIGELKKLLRLYVEGNKLTAVPGEMGGLESLEELHLEKNKLSSLPVELKNISTLKNLFVSVNKLMSIPKEIVAMKNLVSIAYFANPMNIPEEFRSEGLNGLKKYYGVEV
jgi:Leucine-rich repeat (LRR) protein